jgi:hypothetical protein
MITIPSTTGTRTVSFATNSTMANILEVSAKCSKTGERVPGLDHPIDNWIKASCLR